MLWQAQGDKPKAASSEDYLTAYDVTVHTANVQDAGTDADVSLVVYSNSGQ